MPRFLDPEAVELLETLIWYGPDTRQALSIRTGLSRARLATLLGVLGDAGWIIQRDETASTGGRRARKVGLNPHGGYLLAIILEDDGGSVVLADTALEPLTTTSCSYALRDGPGKVMALVVRALREALETSEVSPDDVVAVGVSIPGPVDRTTGLLVDPPSMPGWEGFSLQEHLEGAVNAPVFIDNDANIMALGELWQTRREGPASGEEHWLVVKLSGTGIGAGVIAGGRLYRGVGGGAGELGHIQVDAQGPRCTCGHRGCLETVAAAPAVLKSATEAALRGDSQPLQEMIDAKGTLAITDLARVASEGDDVANKLLLSAGGYIGGVLAGVVNVLNPSKVLIGGAFAYVGPLMLASVRQAIYGRSLPLMSRQISVDYVRSRRASAAGTLAYAAVELLQRS